MSIVRLGLAICLVVATPWLAHAQSAPEDLRLPMFETGGVEGTAAKLAWPPGVRRAPALLAELRRRATADIAVYAGAKPKPPFVRFVQERMASERFESVVVATDVRELPAAPAEQPETFDIAAGKLIGWADLLDPASKDTGAKAVYDFAARALRAKFPPKSGKDGETQAQDLKLMTHWMAATPEALPAFAFVPATDASHIAGLTLFFGAPTALGRYDGEPLLIGEIFMPAAKLKAWLAPAYSELFGGAGAPVGAERRERNDGAPSGESAVMLSKAMKPGKTLTFKAEAPSTFFNDKGEIEVVVDDEALGAPFVKDPKAKAFVAVGHAMPDAKQSGIGFDLRVFSVTIQYPVDKFAAACRGAAMHFQAAKGSPAAAAKAPWIDMSYPIAFDCGDYQG